MESIQYENAVKLKASTFVGRTDLVEKAFHHCSTIKSPHSLILHGEPGCGKSGLLAKVAVLVMESVKKADHFFLFTQLILALVLIYWKVK